MKVFEGVHGSMRLALFAESLSVFYDGIELVFISATLSDSVFEGR